MAGDAGSCIVDKVIFSIKGNWRSTKEWNLGTFPMTYSSQ